MRVHPFTWSDITGCVADRLAEFHDGLPRSQVSNRDFMSGRNSIHSAEWMISVECRAFRHIVKGNGDIVIRVQLQHCVVI